MKKVALIFSLLAICGFAMGCGDDNGGGDNCTKAESLQMDGMDEGCAGKDADCWFCDCWNKDQSVDVQVDGTEVVYSCKAADPCVDDPDTPDVDECDPACDGARLTSADQCLADEAACKAAAATTATSACDAMPK